MSAWHVAEHPGSRGLSRFARDADGAITFYYLVIFLLMLVSGGMASDMMRQHLLRTEIQYAMDRGVLAVASLNSPVANDDQATAMIDSFIRASTFIGSDDSYALDVSVTIAPTRRAVQASVRLRSPNVFLPIIGFDALPVVADSAAAHAWSPVEISMVLDVSGSMLRQDDDGVSRLQRLRDAVRPFVERVMADGASPLTTISLVPFAGNVNAGPLFDDVAAARLHPWSSCVWMEDDDHLTTALPTGRMQESYWHRGQLRGNRRFGYCPSNAALPPSDPMNPVIDFPGLGERPLSNRVGTETMGLHIRPFMSDPDAIMAVIDNLGVHDSTDAAAGMKWGMALLDPALQPRIATFAADETYGERWGYTIDPAFANRPRPWDDPETRKIVILLTDGETIGTRRVKPSYYDSADDRMAFATYVAGEGEPESYCDDVPETALCWWEHPTIPSDYETTTEPVRSRAENEAMLDRQCRLARGQEWNGEEEAWIQTGRRSVRVFAIAFDAGSAAETLMRDCASSPADYFDIGDGTQLIGAFETIASTIESLKLTNYGG